MIKELIKQLDGAELFLRNRADAEASPLNEYDTEIMYGISELINKTIAVLERAIVPPCKVGDTVYKVIRNNAPLGIAEYIVKGFHFGKFTDGLGHKRKNYLIVKYRTNCLLHHIPFDAIGETAFFNKEEAAAKLAETERFLLLPELRVDRLE